MAKRPVFIPLRSGSKLVDEVPISFYWHAGMAPIQKKKNVVELHEAASKVGLSNLLEISSKSDREIGRKLSAFYQVISFNGHNVPLECIYQGSKVFENGGPFTDLFWASPRDAKRDSRLAESGRLTGFEFDGKSFSLEPMTAFYDWLYLNAIYPERVWLKRLSKLDGFTDIEFNPEKSVNCQARSCALFVSLQGRDVLDEALRSFEAFCDRAYHQSGLV